MVLYLIAIMIGFVLAGLYIKKGPSELEDQLMAHVMMGKRVIISVDDNSYIFEMVDGKIRITSGICNFTPEPIDVNDVDNLQSNQSDSSSSSL